MAQIAILYSYEQLTKQVQEKVKTDYKNDPLHYTQLLYYKDGRKYSHTR